MDYRKLYEKCRLCPRNCGVNRLQGESGFCREGSELRVSHVGPHFGEEPPLAGTRGSGTVFFTGCSLRCSFCQNYQISREGLGLTMGIPHLLDRIAEMVRRGVHNVNMVTPDQFFPHLFELSEFLRSSHRGMPIVYNLSGYQSRDMLKMAQPFADIYLPDFKYSDRGISARLSGCRNYPDVALDAITEMLRQKGFLVCAQGGEGLAQKGVLVRHLILPGMVQNSLDALTTLFLEFGPHLPLSIMSQYTPVRPLKQEKLNGPLDSAEFDLVYQHALELGFERLFVQFPGGEESAPSLVPDFQKDDPFSFDSGRI